MRIGELARRVGVAPRLLRYYEEQGLLRPQRAASGYREYAEADVDVVHHVRTLLAAGLSTATIAELLPCMGADGPRLVASCPELLDDLYRERDRITAMIDELAAARDGLDAVIATAVPDDDRYAASC
ncbi:MerR family transcriptional regulator [Actinomycetospora lemnae]|uniref:MerR family transcriptional regulator n=1 Tax=Actinomycetospora lemnae TaxID=3019891 RepID=A0ABT5T035_9PSEU|nr:MerR family transcriptional regulator [Actinomycetospora sp. DW7H6]MDD7968379.1 MerR family transcriptional regulator [Actinomycetospora sp. DW7H6]